MRLSVYGAAILAYIVGGSVTYAVVRWLGKGSPELAFIVGAVLGTQLAAVVHHRSPGAVSSASVKARIGAMLALSTVLLGVALQATLSPFEHPEVSIPIAVVGTFIFPFVLFDTMWNALSKRTDA